MKIVSRVSFLVVLVGVLVLSGCDSLVGNDNDNQGGGSLGETPGLPGGEIAGWEDSAAHAGSVVQVEFLGLSGAAYGEVTVPAEGIMPHHELPAREDGESFLEAEDLEMFVAAGAQGVQVEPSDAFFDLLYVVSEHNASLNLRNDSPQVFVAHIYANGAATIQGTVVQEERNVLWDASLSLGWNRVVQRVPEDGNDAIVREGSLPDDVGWVLQ